MPSEEDCSCYIRSCASGFLLTQDYECVSTTNWKPNFQCQPIIPELHYDNEANSKITSILEKGNADSDYGLMMIMLFVVITIVYAITAGIWLIWKKSKPAKGTTTLQKSLQYEQQGDQEDEGAKTKTVAE